MAWEVDKQQINCELKQCSKDLHKIIGSPIGFFLDQTKSTLMSSKKSYSFFLEMKPLRPP